MKRRQLSQEARIAKAMRMKPKPPPMRSGHVWDTKRLRVFMQKLKTPDGSMVWVFTGWLFEGSNPRSAVTATMGRPNCLSHPGKVTAPLWWITTDEDFRRQGLAMELVLSIHKKWVPVDAWGETDSGDKFCDAFERQIMKTPKKSTPKKSAKKKPRK